MHSQGAAKNLEIRYLLGLRGFTQRGALGALVAHAHPMTLKATRNIRSKIFENEEKYKSK